MISFVVIEFVLLEDLFITNLVIYQYIPFFFLFSILKITPINGKNLKKLRIEKITIHKADIYLIFKKFSLTF